MAATPRTPTVAIAVGLAAAVLVVSAVPAATQTRPRPPGSTPVHRLTEPRVAPLPERDTSSAGLYGKVLAKLRKSKKHEVITLSAGEIRKGTRMLLANRRTQIAALKKRGVPVAKILAAMGLSAN